MGLELSTADGHKIRVDRGYTMDIDRIVEIDLTNDELFEQKSTIKIHLTEQAVDDLRHMLSN